MKIAVRKVFHVNENFLWKRPIKEPIFSNVADIQSPTLLGINEGVFREFWLQVKEEILNRIFVLQSSYFWAKLPVTVRETFLSLSFVCI